MRKYLNVLFLILISTVCLAQQDYKVTAKTFLNVRSNPHAEAQIMDEPPRLLLPAGLADGECELTVTTQYMSNTKLLKGLIRLPCLIRPSSHKAVRLCRVRGNKEQV